MRDLHYIGRPCNIQENASSKIGLHRVNHGTFHSNILATVQYAREGEKLKRVCALKNMIVLTPTPRQGLQCPWPHSVCQSPDLCLAREQTAHLDETCGYMNDFVNCPVVVDALVISTRKLWFVRSLIRLIHTSDHQMTVWLFIKTGLL